MMDINGFKRVNKKPPHDTSIWVKIIARIKNNITGEIRDYCNDAIWDEEKNEPALWIWQEGNYACDCNRYLFFQRAKREKQVERGCSDGKYSVNIYNAKNMELLYKEFDE